jgi:8-oxo-dGTP pyrophosphatase MutT (NUDIX family)
MTKPVQNGPEVTVFQGKLLQIIHTPMQIGEKETIFERAERGPGTRLIIVNNNKVLLTKEYRTELEAEDYRLPGGKVFDSSEEYQNAPQDYISMLQAAKAGVIKEALEETGRNIKSLQLLKISEVGATMKWDLFYFVSTDSEEAQGGQSLEAGEIIRPKWYSFEDAEKLCLEGKMSEDRSVGVLLTYLLNQK